MYAVVGCNECGALWVVEGRPETTGCPRCGKRHRFAKLKAFHEADRESDAREARAALLAARQDRGEEFAAVDSYADLESRLDGAGVDDEAYLAASGLDPDEVAAAGERASEGRAGGGGGSGRRETLLAAVEALDAPTEAAVVEYAAERDVPAEAAREGLAKLVRAGELSEHRGRYRRL